MIRPEIKMLVGACVADQACQILGIEILALHSGLSAGSFARLTVVHAPAGWGKSTLLSAWFDLAGGAGRVAWFSVDRQDNDPVRFKKMEARFSASVYPGDDLTIRIWETGDGQAVFQTVRTGGEVVIDGGGFTYAS